MTKLTIAGFAFSLGALLAGTSAFAGPSEIRGFTGIGAGGVAELAPPPNDGSGGWAYVDMQVGSGALADGSVTVTFPIFNVVSWPHCHIQALEGPTGSWLQTGVVFSDGGSAGVTGTAYPGEDTPDGRVTHTVMWHTAKPLPPGLYGLALDCHG